MRVKTLDESDVMRAADRLVDRIRASQQTRIFEIELVAIIIIVGVLCNLIADAMIAILTAEPQLHQYSIILISSLLMAAFVGFAAYRIRRRYSSGSLGTYVLYRYEAEPFVQETPGSLRDRIWSTIDPSSDWQNAGISSVASTKDRPLLLCFMKKKLEKLQELGTYSISLEGDFVYAILVSHPWYRFGSHHIDLPTMGGAVKVTSCRTTLTLGTSKVSKDRYRITLQANLELETPLSPESDELVQDVAIHLRPLEQNMREVLLNISDKA